MPRKKTPPPAPEPSPMDDDFAVIPADQLPDDATKVLAEVGDDVTRVLLYRKLKGEKQAYVGTIDADDFSMDEVATRYGGGRYVARLVGQDGIIKGVTFYIDEALKPQSKDDKGGGGDVVTGKLVEKMIDRLAGDSKDPFTIAAAMQQAASAQSQAMVAAMMAAITPLLAKITEMGARGGNGASPAEMLQLIEFGADRFGEKDTGWTGVMRDVGLPLVSIAERALGGRGAAPAKLPPPGGSPMQPLPNPPDSAGVPPWVPAIKPYIPQVLSFAERGGDPGVLAGMIDVQVPRFARWLEQAVLDPAFPDQLFAHFPALASHREWVGRLLAEYVDDGGDGGDGGDDGSGNTVTPEPGDED